MKKELHLLIILVQSGLMILNDACKAAQIIRWVEIYVFFGTTFTEACTSYVTEQQANNYASLTNKLRHLLNC